MEIVRRWAGTILLSSLCVSGALSAETLLGSVEAVDLEGRRLVVGGTTYVIDPGRLRVVVGERRVDSDLLTVGSIVQYRTEFDLSAGATTVVEIRLPSSPVESRE